MGLLSSLGGLPIVGPMISGMTGYAQAKAQTHAADLQHASSTAALSANKEVALKQLEFDKEKWEWAKEQAKSPLGQTGSYGYPYVSVKQIKQPSLIVPLAIGAGCFYFFVIKRKR